MSLIHPVLRKFFKEEIGNISLAGRLSQFGKQWKQITRDPEILSAVKEYQIPLTNLQVQEKPPDAMKMSEQQSPLVDQEISELPEKEALFWFRSTYEIFYQIAKNPNCSFEMNKYWVHVLSGRYVADGRTLQEIMTVRDTLIFVLQTLSKI